MHRRSLVSFVLGLVLAVPAFGLGVGDQAPPLNGVTWLQGEEITEFQEGQIYVLDFWATWCGPCIQSIPHLNDLQRRYADDGVNIVGVAVWPRPGMVPTRSFLTRRKDSGKALEYRVAEDSRAGAIVNSYLNPARVTGIPTAMVIDGTGRIVFIDHPMNGLDRVLELLVSGQFSLDTYLEEKAARDRALAQSRVLRQEFQEAYEADNVSRQLEITKELLGLSPELFGSVAGLHYYLLLERNAEPELARRFAERMLAEELSDQAIHLSSFAFQIATSDSIADENRDLEIAGRMASRAVELTKGSDANVLDTLARVQFESGEFEAAVETQRRAVELAPGGDFRDALLENLREFESASGG